MALSWLSSHVGFGPSCRAASLVAQTVKNLPALQEIRVQSLLWEDPLEEGMATHSSILAWRIPLTEEPDGVLSMGLEEMTDLPCTYINNSLISALWIYFCQNI